MSRFARWILLALVVIFLAPATLGAVLPGAVTPINASGSTQSTSGTTTALSPTLTLSAALDFKNGEGIRIEHAGAAFALNAPTNLAVAPTGATGTATCTYTIAAIDNAGGIGAAIANASTTNCYSTSLQPNPTLTVTGAASAGLPNNIKLTVSSTSGIQTGAFAFVPGVTGTTEANGWWQITVNDGTHITLNQSSFQHTWTSGGTVAVRAGSVLTWNAPTGTAPQRYAIYGRTGSLQLVGILGSSGNCTTASPSVCTFTDYGDAFSAEPAIPTTPPASALADYLVTTISAGGGTTSLTLAAAPTTSGTQNVTHDDGAAIQACLNAVQAGGGISGVTCLLPSTGSYQIAQNLTIPVSTTLACGMNTPGDPGTGNYSTPSGIRLDSGATMTLSQSSSLRGCLVTRYGMVFPSPDGQAYAGTALTGLLPSVSTVSGDMRLDHNLVIGFGRCLQAGTDGSHEVSRVVVYDFAGDCSIGLDLGGSGDSSHYTVVHIYPYGTAWFNNFNPAPTAQFRSGPGVYVHGISDDTDFDQIAVLGHAPNYQFASNGNMNIGSLWSDDFNGAPSNHTGLSFNGVGAVNVANVTAYNGYNCLNFANADVRIANVYCNGGAIGGGDHVVIGGTGNIQIGHLTSFNSGGCAVNYGSIAANLDIETLEVGGFNLTKQSAPVGLNVGSTNDKIRIKRYRPLDTTVPAALFVGNLGCPTVASAATMSVGIGYVNECLEVQGNTNILALTGGDRQQVITLLFDQALTVVDHNNGGNNIYLANSTNFTTQTGSVLVLRNTPSPLNAWVEISKKF